MTNQSGWRKENAAKSEFRGVAATNQKHGDTQYMLKFVVQARDTRGHWCDHQAAWDYKEARELEILLLNDETAWKPRHRKKQTRIVPADKANSLYHL